MRETYKLTTKESKGITFAPVYRSRFLYRLYSPCQTQWEELEAWVESLQQLPSSYFQTSSLTRDDLAVLNVRVLSGSCMSCAAILALDSLWDSLSLCTPSHKHAGRIADYLVVLGTICILEWILNLTNLGIIWTNTVLLYLMLAILPKLKAHLVCNTAVCSGKWGLEVSGL